MFKLVVLSGLLTVALAKPSSLVPPVIIGNLVSEKTLESHGNSVVHAAAPVITPAIPLLNAVEHVVPVAPVTGAHATAIVSEKTIDSHGHSIAHHNAPAETASYEAPALQLIPTTQRPPLIGTAPPAQLIPTTQRPPVIGAAPPAPLIGAAPPAPLIGAAPPVQLIPTTQRPSFIGAAPPASLMGAAPPAPLLGTAPTKQLVEKSESSRQNKQLIDKIETIAQQSNQVQSQEKAESYLGQSSESQKRKETAQNKQLVEKTESQGQFIIHQASPAVLTYQAAALANILAPSYVVPAGVPSLTLYPQKDTLDSSQKPQNPEQPGSAESKQQSAERLESLENGAIREVPAGLHLAAAPVYYYPYPAAVLAEKSISSYGHSIIHGV